MCCFICFIDAPCKLNFKVNLCNHCREILIDINFTKIKMKSCFYCCTLVSCKWGFFNDQESCYPCIMYFKKNPDSPYIKFGNRPRRRSPIKYSCFICLKDDSSCWYRSTGGHICETCYRRNKRQMKKMSVYFDFDK